MTRSITAVLGLAFVSAIASMSAFSVAGPSTQPSAPAYPLTKCVVSGQPLGDTAVTETIDGREVKFCCDKCPAKFKAGGEEMQKKMDQQIIDTQKKTYKPDTCLVSDEKLGGDMGEPIMYVNRATNQLVEFCCNSCVKKFKADPAKYLAKLDAASAK